MRGKTSSSTAMGHRNSGRDRSQGKLGAKFDVTFPSPRYRFWIHRGSFLRASVGVAIYKFQFNPSKWDDTVVTRSYHFFKCIIRNASKSHWLWEQIYKMHFWLSFQINRLKHYGWTNFYCDCETHYSMHINALFKRLKVKIYQLIPWIIT